MPEAKKASRTKVLRGLIAACLVLLLAGGGIFYQQACAVASVVSLDVNPSIELRINRREKVLSCTALNQEGAAVLFSMDGGADLKGAKLDVAVNAIVGALVREGYLDSLSSAILISVEDRDQSRAARLQQELAATVDGILQAQVPGAFVVSQTLTQDAGPEPAAGYSGVSQGKAALVQKVMDQNGIDAGAFDRLAALSVEELDGLLKTGEARVPIGRPAACLAAEEYAGTLEMDSVTAGVDPELDEVPACYEVELHTAWGDFDYKVDAFTGEVFSGQKDILNPPSSAPAAPGPTPEPPASLPSDQVQDVGQDAAKRAALDHAGLSESEVTGMTVERDWDDGRLTYEIEFWCGATEYDYTIDGHSCAVLEHEWDHHTDDVHDTGSHHGNSHHTAASASPSADIGRAAAKQAALDHAGVTESQTSKMEVKQDWDGGRLEYEVEFKSGGMEYEYIIDGATGAVLEYETDWDG